MTIPESVRSELKRLEEAGHTLMLATGRSHSMVEDHLWEGFAGAVLAGGAQVVVGGRSVVERPLEEATARILVDTLERLGCPHLIECTDDTYLGRSSEALYAFFARYGRAAGITREAAPDEALSGVLKLEANVSAQQAPALRAVISGLPDVRHLEMARMHDADFSFEVYGADVTKAGGVRAALDVLGGTREESYAFGDGAIDSEMLSWCGCGVAMGNASQEVREAADVVCADMHEGGLAEALRGIV